MSVRPPPSSRNGAKARHAAAEANVQVAAAPTPSLAATAHGGGVNDRTLSFDDLTPHEQAVASLGIEADALKPIGWINDMHYEGLKKNNSLDPELQRRIEAHKAYHGGNRAA